MNFSVSIAMKFKPNKCLRDAVHYGEPRVSRVYAQYQKGSFDPLSACVLLWRLLYTLVLFRTGEALAVIFEARLG